MNTYATLIDARTLAGLPAQQVLIVDCRADLADRARSQASYREGHIPGAVHADIETELSDPARQADGLGRHPLPSAEAFSAVLGRWGWHPGLQVVAYDTAAGALAAARLWWMLRVAGVREVAVLDGGLAAWEAAGLPLERGAVERLPTRVGVHFDPRQVLLDAQALHAGPAPLLLDARAQPRYRGEVEPIDRVAGHVPGARNRPFSGNLQEDGRFKAPGTLREEFGALLGDTPPGQVVHMCGSGVTACHNLLAMEHAGLHGSRLYAPSWSGWISDPARPVATGDAG